MNQNQITAEGQRSTASSNTNSNISVLASARRAGLPASAVKAWRESIFDAVAAQICDPNLPIIQRSIGMWKWHTGINVPARRDINILGDGAMSLIIPFEDGAHKVHFSIWMYLGEVRIGVHVPRDFMDRAPELSREIEHAFDGSACQRVAESPTDTFYDWIFRDKGFAETQLMADSMRDVNLSVMIADAIGNVLTHLYMAVMNALVNHEIYMVAPDGMKRLGDTKQIVLEVFGMPEEDMSRVTGALMGISLHINNIYPQEDGRIFYLMTIPVKNEDEIRIGIGNVIAGLGGEYEVRDVENI